MCEAQYHPYPGAPMQFLFGYDPSFLRDYNLLPKKRTTFEPLGRKEPMCTYYSRCIYLSAYVFLYISIYVSTHISTCPSTCVHIFNRRRMALGDLVPSLRSTTATRSRLWLWLLRTGSPESAPQEWLAIWQLA